MYQFNTSVVVRCRYDCLLSLTFYFFRMPSSITKPWICALCQASTWCFVLIYCCPKDFCVGEIRFLKLLNLRFVGFFVHLTFDDVFLNTKRHSIKNVLSLSSFRTAVSFFLGQSVFWIECQVGYLKHLVHLFQSVIEY